MIINGRTQVFVQILESSLFACLIACLIIRIAWLPCNLNQSFLVVSWISLKLKFQVWTFLLRLSKIFDNKCELLHYHLNELHIYYQDIKQNYFFFNYLLGLRPARPDLAGYVLLYGYGRVMGIKFLLLPDHG